MELPRSADEYFHQAEVGVAQRKPTSQKPEYFHQAEVGVA